MSRWGACGVVGPRNAGAPESAKGGADGLYLRLCAAEDHYHPHLRVTVAISAHTRVERSVQSFDEGGDKKAFLHVEPGSRMACDKACMKCDFILRRRCLRARKSEESSLIASFLVYVSRRHCTAVGQSCTPLADEEPMRWHAIKWSRAVPSRKLGRVA